MLHSHQERRVALRPSWPSLATSIPQHHRPQPTRRAFDARLPNRLAAELDEVLRPDGAGPHRDHCSGGPTRYPEPRIVRIKGAPPATSSFLRRLLTCTASTSKSASALLS